jgi:hypothetical protein
LPLSFSFFLFFFWLLQEQGDLKLRVRTLESERAFQRVAAVQKTIGYVSSELLMNGLLFVFHYASTGKKCKVFLGPS